MTCAAATLMAASTAVARTCSFDQSSLTFADHDRVVTWKRDGRSSPTIKSGRMTIAVGSTRVMLRSCVLALLACALFATPTSAATDPTFQFPVSGHLYAPAQLTVAP